MSRAYSLLPLHFRMASSPPSYSSIVHPSAPSIDNPPPRPPPAKCEPMVYPVQSPMVAPPMYAQPQPLMVPYGVPMQSAPAPVTNIVIQSGGPMGGGQIASPMLCSKCKQGVLINQRNKCIKVTIIVVVVITFPFGLLFLPLLCCIWQKKCPVCLRVSGSPIGMKR